jgi:hypothetical protein
MRSCSMHLSIGPPTSGHLMSTASLDRALSSRLHSNREHHAAS